MNQKKILSTVVIGLMLLSVAVAIAPTINAVQPDYDVAGFVFVDGVETDGVDVTLSVPGQEDITVTSYHDELYDLHGIYKISFFANQGQNASFTVHYGYNYFIPDPEELLIDQPSPNSFNDVNLSINTDTTNPPNKPILIAPSNGHSFDVGTTTVTLQAQVTDPDGDMMDVYFYNADGDSLIDTYMGVENGDTAQVEWSVSDGNTYNWYAVAEDSIKLSESSDVWSFTTEEEPEEPPSPPPSPPSPPGGGGGGGGTPSPPPSPPTADANGDNGEYYASLIDGVAEVTFDGSGSSGIITSYSWDFGDGETGTGVSLSHQYTALGRYNVTLTVTGPGGSDSDQAFAVIGEEQNLPPSTPVVSGEQKGSVDIDYEYSAVSTDDDNDTIQYIFDWGDGTNTTTDFVANATSVTQTHNWSTWGIYTVKVKASDDKTESGTKEYVVLIDVLYVKNIGYLIDTNSNGTYDKFYSNETTEQTSVEKLVNGSYLINSDTDSEWDWIYDPQTDELTVFSSSEPEKGEDYTLWYALIIIVIIMLLMIAAAAGKKKKPKKKAKKPKK